MAHKKCAELTAHFFVIGRENPPHRDGVAAAACFLSLRHISGHPFDKCRKFTLSARALRQIGGKIQKCDFGFFKKILLDKSAALARAEGRFADFVSSRRNKILRRGGKTRTVFPSALVVARRSLRAARDTRSAPLGAAAPPLPKKFFDTFWEPCIEGTPLRMRAAFTPSVSRSVGKLSCAAQKRGFACANNFRIGHPKSSSILFGSPVLRARL